MTQPDLDAVAAPVIATEGDRAFARLVREHFEGLMMRSPGLATYLGIHAQDHRLADLSREAYLGGMEDERRYEAALLAIDPATLSPATAFEREIALFGVRRARFDAEVHGAWERRARAADEIGDSLFMLFARPFAPLAERLEAITERLVAAPPPSGRSGTDWAADPSGSGSSWRSTDCARCRPSWRRSSPRAPMPGAVTILGRPGWPVPRPPR